MIEVLRIKNTFVVTAGSINLDKLRISGRDQ